MSPLLLLACAVATPEEEEKAPLWTDPGVAPLVEPEEEPEPTPQLVVINEFMPDNESTIEDEHGFESDWVELLVVSDAPVDLSGWGLTDSPDEGPLWSFAEGTVLQPGERRLLWLDGAPELGTTHLPFRLDADGGELVLSDADGAEHDRLQWADLPADVVRARFPDGSDVVADSVLATPYNSNPWDPGTSLDPSDRLFPQDEVLTVHLQLPEASLAALRSSPYTYVEGSVSIGAVTLSPVGVRIKGQWGSLRSIDDKAAFKVSMDAFEGTAEMMGMENLTFNNMVQDPSLINERIAYRLFREMDVPAPRTAHVALYLNGEYRGIYLHVESADDTFLARWFPNPEGNLYEGAYGQDVVMGSYTSLDHDELGADDPDDYSDLRALAMLLALPPTEERVEELEALVDVDRVLAMLAGEVIIGHWDGYFYYPNNYRIYHDPDSGRFTLLPWGLDQTFAWEGGIEDASGQLAAWMLEIPSLNARYRLALWKAADLMTELELPEEAVVLHDLALPYLRASSYEEYSVDTSLAYLRTTVSYCTARPENLLSQL